jgi:hypothetical protein
LATADISHPASLSSRLFSKQGQVITNIAGLLLKRQPGDTIMRVQDYAEFLGASAGTVHAALTYLRDAEAVSLEGRGRLGTIVNALNYPLLWRLAPGRPLVGVLPLPYTKRFEGLATGIRSQFGAQPIDLDMRFERGSTHRLQQLASRQVDWVLLSRFAAESAAVQGFEVDIVMLLGRNTYTINHILLCRHGTTKLEDGMRVGIDIRSPDHSWVVRMVCRGLQVDLVEIDYSKGLQLLQRGDIDLVVWTKDDLPFERDDLSAIPLSNQIDPNLELLSEATIVVDRGNKAAANVLKSVLDCDELYRAQSEVVNLARLPAY